MTQDSLSTRMRVPGGTGAHRDTPPENVLYRGRSPGLQVITAIRLPGASSPVTW